MRGELSPDAGDVELPARWTLAHVAQETPAVRRPRSTTCSTATRSCASIERALADGGADRMTAAQIAELHHRFEAIGGYGARARAATLLRGPRLHRRRSRRSRSTSFSGGWRMRLNLAQALMCRSDLLLLDEPTNHLDLDAMLWLEDWLRALSRARCC